MEKKELITRFVDKGCLLSAELLPALENENPEVITKLLEQISERKDKPLIITSKFFLMLREGQEGLQVKPELKTEEKKPVKVMGPQVVLEKPKELEVKKEKLAEVEKEEKEIRKFNDIKILYSYNGEIKKIGTEDFAAYFRNRYLKLREILSTRSELEKTVSINKIGNQREEFSVIGMVQEKRITKNGNVFVVLEDLTGSVKVIAPSRNKEVFEKAENLTYDEVVGIRGRGSSQFLFANEIVQVDLPIKDKKQGGKGYALFISDLHVGSDKFLKKEFKNFIRWLNLETDGKHKKVAKECKYLFILGDLVDGVGVYPAQEKELFIKDLNEQYEEAAYLLSQIRDDVKIIAIPGNHDATRAAIPQPIFDEKYASPLYKIKNLLLLSNPSYVNIASTENFEGYDVYLYHGYSLNYYANNIRSLINKGYKNPELLLTYLLRKRHLAPTHGSTPYIPVGQDPLLIERVPDVLVTGELHKLSTSYYNNVALITCSCWQGKTPFQVKVGHEPDPCKVTYMDLKENSLKVLDFS